MERKKIASRPFWVSESAEGRGSITYADFEPSSDDVETIVLHRKYPIKARLVERARALIGTTIVGANCSDFSDAKTLWALDSMPTPNVARYPFRETDFYRYYQMRTPGACDISILEWLTDTGNIKSVTKRQ